MWQYIKINIYIHVYIHTYSSTVLKNKTNCFLNQFFIVEIHENIF